LAKDPPKIRDARFRDRPSKGPTPPRLSSSGEPRAARGVTPSEPPRSNTTPAKAPWWRSGDVIIPVVLAVGVSIAGWQFYRAQNPTPPPAPAPELVPATADAGAPVANDVPPATPDIPSVPAAPGPSPLDRALDGAPVEGRIGEPTSPDPMARGFSMTQATEGLTGTGALTAEIETSLGDFTCTLLEREAPLTVANFVGLARGRRPFWDPVSASWARRPFYDGSIFHRVIPGFMIQGGDQMRSGSGGTGYTIVDENVRPHNAGGQLCMANRGPNTGSSQFFITEVPRDHLDGTYSIFGNCTPTALVARITAVPRGPSDRPTNPVFIRHVRVRRG
jgi:peptidyl-prolyl cis-trans isomerase A (cyclophilin A)